MLHPKQGAEEMIQKAESLAKLARRKLKKRILAKLRLSLLVNEKAAKRKKPRSKSRSVRCLSPKQIQILKLLLDGYSYAEIAKELFIAESTIRSHVRHVYRILGVKGRYELIANLSRDEFDLICKRFTCV
jgi:DNA-binding CsgD family transcriptional regulator